MNRVQFARQKLLLGNFLASDDLTQAEYEVVTNPNTKDSVILAMFDSKTGGHLSNRVQNSLDEGPVFCHDAGVSEESDSDEGENPDDEPLTEPEAPTALTPALPASSLA